MIVFRPFPVLTLCALPALVLLVMLGVWQLQRANEKSALIASLAQAQAQAPASFQAWLDGKPMAAAHEWRLFSWSPADLQFEDSVLLRTPRARICEWLIPLRSKTGSIILQAALVTCPPQPRPGREEEFAEHEDSDQRNFWRAELLAQLPEQPLAVLRAIPRQGLFSLKNVPQNALFYSVDSDAILRIQGLAPALPGFFLASNRLPVLRDPLTGPASGETAPIIAQPNPQADASGGQRIKPETHIGYALTWFGFGITLIWIYLAFHQRAGRLSLRRRPGEE